MTTSQPANGPKPADGWNAAILRRLELVWGTVAAEPEGELGKGAWEFEDLLRAAVPVALTLATEALELREENARLEAEVERLKTYYEQCLGLAQAAKYACFTAKTSAPTLAVTGNQLMDAVEHLVQENARLARELEQVREDAEVGRLVLQLRKFADIDADHYSQAKLVTDTSGAWWVEGGEELFPVPIAGSPLAVLKAALEGREEK